MEAAADPTCASGGDGTGTGDATGAGSGGPSAVPLKRDRPVVPEGMTKSAWKRQQKQAAQHEARVARRQQEKAAKQAARATKGPPAPTADLTPEQRAAMKERRHQRADEERSAFVAKCDRGPRIVFDCDFFDLMNDREKRSIVVQLTRVYSCNRRSETPCHITFAGVCPAMYSLLDGPGFKSWPLRHSAEPISTLLAPSDLVYLSADATAVIDKLEAGKSYVVGAFVDKNRHKGLTARKAAELGIATARLPINEFVALTGCTVMTTLHVFEILHAYHACGNWKEAVLTALPARKNADRATGAGAGKQRKRKGRPESGVGGGGGSGGAGAAAGAGASGDDCSTDGEGDGEEEEEDASGGEEVGRDVVDGKGASLGGDASHHHHDSDVEHPLCKVARVSQGEEEATGVPEIEAAASGGSATS